MWPRTSLLLLLLGTLASHALDVDQGYTDEEADAVVIEASPLPRRGRQLDPASPILRDLELSPGGEIPCVSKDKGVGTCMDLKSCYKYFKIYAFTSRDTWVMGLYNTCSYQSARGRQVFGVCCNNELPAEMPVEEEETNTQIDEENEAVIDERFPIEAQETRDRSCGRRPLVDGYPRVVPTLYSPAPAPLYSAPALPYIVNGQEARRHEYPFMAALMNLQRQFCGGSLIDDNHILTAAHCVAHMSKYDVQNLRVRLGDHNIKDGSYDGTTVEKRVKRVIRHKGFSSSTLWNDVAILTLEDDVKYNDHIQPICLAEGSQKYVDNRVTVAGWGTLSEGGSQPSNLMKVEVNVWTNDRCKKSYGSSAPGGITSHMLCASDYKRDSCSGDSGGPLFHCKGQCEQIGIVSWGIGCAKAKYPGVYTRVTEMMPWIQRIVEQY